MYAAQALKMFNEDIAGFPVRSRRTMKHAEAYLLYAAQMLKMFNEDIAGKGR